MTPAQYTELEIKIFDLRRTICGKLYDCDCDYCVLEAPYMKVAPDGTIVRNEGNRCMLQRVLDHAKNELD